VKEARKLTPNSIVTYTGRIIEPLDPNPEDIDLGDIAHALSNQCRFTGHTNSFYSVAQHSVLVSHYCDPSDAKWGLLHDASEAYLSDIARPLKRDEVFGKVYKRYEGGIQEAVGRRFKLNAEMPQSVKEADDLLLRWEMRDLMHPRCSEDSWVSTYDLEALPRLKTWSPSKSAEEFTLRYKELFGD
jgi:5'-deoxynucleotidase YfbR-like HD superfamily hydrolase